MSIRRYYVPDSIVFITQVVDYRNPVFRDAAHLQQLRAICHLQRYLSYPRCE
jgi:REP element-mobilizing transposase RayT